MTIDFKQDILAPVAQDFAAMDTFINEGITSKVALVMAVSKHVVEAGGKRMRPIHVFTGCQSLWCRRLGTPA
jgi:octaprenyl-diphosphate synthase